MLLKSDSIVINDDKNTFNLFFVDVGVRVGATPAVIFGGDGGDNNIDVHGNYDIRDVASIWNAFGSQHNIHHRNRGRKQ